MSSRFKSIILAAVALACFASMALPAFAVPMKAVFSGAVSGSNDQTNYYGQGTGPALDGLAYTLTFLYDPQTPGANRATNGFYDTAYGGTLFGPAVASPIQSAVLTIGGVSHDVSPAQYSAGLAYGGSYYQQVAQDTFDDGASFNRYNYVTQIVYGSSVTSDLEAPLGIFAMAFPPYGQFQFSNFDYALGQYAYLASGSLAATSLTVSAVPLPAALPLFAAGIGALGVIARRRKKRPLP
jgi:hypothetical protein